MSCTALYKEMSVFWPTLIDNDGGGKITTPVNITSGAYAVHHKPNLPTVITWLNHHLFQFQQNLKIITIMKGGFIARLLY